MHPSINNRMELLRRLSADPAAADRFERKMRITRRLIVSLLVLGVAAFGAAMFLPEPPSSAAPATQPTTEPESQSPSYVQLMPGMTTMVGRSVLAG
jgi:hypothetical protein